MPPRFRLWFNHRFNPLHWYCRLVETGLGKIIPLWLAQQYERFIYSWVSPLVGWFFKNKKDDGLTDEENARLDKLLKRQERRVAEGTRKLFGEIRQSQNEPESTEAKIRRLASVVGVDAAWALAIAEVESSMGQFQKSKTGARGVFQMTTIAMKDLWLQMELQDDDLADILCGLLFLRLLKNRWGSKEEATRHYCDPNDRDFYVPKVLMLMDKYHKGGQTR